MLHRPIRRWLVAVAAALGASHAAAAQPSVPLRVQPVDESWSTRIRATGEASLCRDFTCAQGASLGIDLSPLRLWHLSMEGAAGRHIMERPAGTTADRRADLYFGGRRARLWVGRGVSDRADAELARTSRSTWLESGAAVRWNEVDVTVSVGRGMSSADGQSEVTESFQLFDSLSGKWQTQTVTRRVTDSTATSRAPWRSTELRLGWQSDRWSANGVIGWLTSRSEAPMEESVASEPSRLVHHLDLARVYAARGDIVWAGAGAERRVNRDIALRASAGTYPRLLSLGGSPLRWAFNVGVRAATAWGSVDPHAEPRTEPSSDPQWRSDADAFEAVPLGPDRYRLVVRLAGATQVELASDCTAWKPVAMRHLHDDLWMVELSAQPGSHRISIRLDGGRWLAPPGLMGEEDDFGGSTGVFVIR
jgi:hypothetical protein